MKKVAVLLLTIVPLFLSCSLGNQCELTEKYEPAWSAFVLDKRHQKYGFRVSFNQIVELYRGDCPPDKNINETRLKITSDAPCDQVIKLQIDVNMGPDSYQIKEDSLAIEAKGTVDLGVVAYGGGRIDFAAIEIAIYCPLCPEDLP